MRTLPVTEFRRLDLNSEEVGVPVRTLMANAGRALADEADAMAPDGRIVLLCGKGNNGGDGYAACVELQSRGRDAISIAVEPPTGAESIHFRDRCHGVVPWSDFDGERPALAVDCLLGSGIQGDPRPPYDAAIDWLNDQRAAGVPVLACDIPSAFQVPADATVTFHAAKEGMTEANSGRIVMTDIGIPPEAATQIGFGDLAVGYPRASAASHKGQNGVVLVVGGGPYTGAPYYASVAAYRAGADLVPAFIPAKAAAAVRCYGPEPIVHDAGTDHLDDAGADAVIEFLPKATALLIGPGLGRHPETLAAVQRILTAAADAGLPVVIDADGLQGIPDAYWKQHGNRTVITPHAREFRDLAGSEATDEAVASFAAHSGCVVVRKGAADVIAAPNRIKHCPRGHPAMTVGGTGDVLAGAIAAVVSRGADPFDAAAAGTYLVNVAGEAAARELGDGLTALDVADHIPAILARLG